MSMLARSLKPLVLSAAACVAFAALAEETGPSAAIPAGMVQPVMLPGSGFRVGVDSFSIGGKANPSQVALLAGIAGWLSAEFDLPAISEMPAVTVASERRMKGRRLRDVPSERSHGHEAEIVAVYDDEARTIYLPDAWTGKTAADFSVLVHEMVHHIQNLNGQKFACPEEREAMAYDAQQRWLGLFGGTLEADFGVDPFTVLVRTKCFH